MIIKESINMRFTQGYWVIRQDYVMSYATQTVRVIKNDKELHIISACARFATAAIFSTAARLTLCSPRRARTSSACR